MPDAWGYHVNSFCRQILVVVLTPTTRFSTNLVPWLRVHYKCKGELKGSSLNARIHCEMFRATCLAMFWRLWGILCCLSTKHSRDWQNVITSYSQKLLKYFCCELTTATTVSGTAKTQASRTKSHTRSRRRIWRSLLSLSLSVTTGRRLYKGSENANRKKVLWTAAQEGR